MKISSKAIRETLGRVWPYAVAGVMIGYVVLLVFLVKADVAATSAIVGAK